MVLETIFGKIGVISTLEKKDYVLLFIFVIADFTLKIPTQKQKKN